MMKYPPRRVVSNSQFSARRRRNRAMAWYEALPGFHPVHLEIKNESAAAIRSACIKPPFICIIDAEFWTVNLPQKHPFITYYRYMNSQLITPRGKMSYRGYRVGVVQFIRELGMLIFELVGESVWFRGYTYFVLPSPCRGSGQRSSQLYMHEQLVNPTFCHTMHSQRFASRMKEITGEKCITYEGAMLLLRQQLCHGDIYAMPCVYEGLSDSKVQEQLQLHHETVVQVLGELTVTQSITRRELATFCEIMCGASSFVTLMNKDNYDRDSFNNSLCYYNIKVSDGSNDFFGVFTRYDIAVWNPLFRDVYGSAKLSDCFERMKSKPCLVHLRRIINDEVEKFPVHHPIRDCWMTLVVTVGINLSLAAALR